MPSIQNPGGQILIALRGHFHIMSEHDEKLKLLEEIRQKIECNRQLQAEYENLSPEERAVVEELRAEDAPVMEFFEEQFQRMLAGEISPEECTRWTDMMDKQNEETWKRRGIDPDR